MPGAAQTPDLIIFDCDGVLVDSEVLAGRVLAAMASQYGPPLSEEDCRQRFIGRSLANVANLLRADGYAIPDDFIEILRAEDRAAFEADLKPIAGVADAVNALPMNMKHCVASSGRLEKIHHSLTITGLLDLFAPNIFSAEQVAHGKPAPDLFLLAAHTMATAPARCLVIEDSPAGIMAARAADMVVWGFHGGSHAGPGYEDALLAAGAAHVFDDMAQLPALLGIAQP